MKPEAVFSLDGSGAIKAEAIAREFGLPFFVEPSSAERSRKEQLRFFEQGLGRLPALAFLIESDVLHLALIEVQGLIKIRAGFHSSSLDYRREKGGGRSEMIAKAVGLKAGKTPSVIDATAGLGVDAFVLASLGCEVTMLERVPAVAALLRDGLERSRAYAAEHDPKLADALARMQLVSGNALNFLKESRAECCPEVVYLDPMFPERKKSAAVKKEMQVFHRLIGPDEDADQLLEFALSVARDRVVVKRPRVAPKLSGPVPSHVMEGKRNRYDVYLIR